MDDGRGFVLYHELAPQTVRAPMTVLPGTLHAAATGYVVRGNCGDEIVDAHSEQGLSYLRSCCDAAGNAVPNGSFAAVFLEGGGEGVTLLSDPIGTIPLYYATQGARLVCGTDWLEVAKGAGKSELSVRGFTQMMTFGYAIGDSTTIDGVYELPPATVARFSRDGATGRITRTERRYWTHVHTDRCSNEKDFTAGLFEVSRHLKARFERYIIRTGKPPLLKLSSGGDSRFLLELFHKLPGLIAVTWGPRFSHDVIVARSLSRQVGVPHCTYSFSGREAVDPQNSSQMARRTGARAVSFIGMGSLTIFEHVPAREYVHLPGHTGDFISGGHIRGYHLRAASREQAVAAALRQHAIPVRYSDGVQPEQAVSFLAQPALVTRPVTEFFDQAKPAEYWHALYRFNMENRQRRYILSDARVLRGNGPVLLPFWDMEVVNFFSGCTLSLLYKKQAYEKFVLRHCITSGELCRPIAWPVNYAPYRMILRESLITGSPIRGIFDILQNRLHQRLSRRYVRYRDQWRYTGSCSKRELAARITRLAKQEPLLDQILTPVGRQAYEATLPWHLVDVLQVMKHVRGLLQDQENSQQARLREIPAGGRQGEK